MDPLMTLTSRKKLTTTVPPKKGPQSNGVEYKYNTDKTVRLLEKKHGRRQNAT